MLRLAGPVVLAEVGWMAMGLVDVAMVGRLGPAAIGAAGIGNVLFLGPSIVGFGLLLGLDTVVAQGFGAGRIDDCRRALVQGTYLALALSPPLMVAIVFGARFLESWGLDPAVVPPARAYLGALVWSLPALLLHTACRRYLQAMGAVRPVAVALIVANLINVAGNWVLVYGHLGAPRLGVAGSGWATVLARIGMAAVLIAAVLERDRGERAALARTSLRPDWALLRRLLALGGPAAGHLALEIGVFAVATVLAGRLGAAALAAHEVALNVCGTTFMVPLGLSSAGAVRVGQAIGRGDARAAVLAGWTALALGVGFMAAPVAAFVLVPRSILGVFTGDEAVIALGVPLLGIAALFQLFDGLQVVATGILRGTGDTRTPLVCNVVAHWLLGLPVGVGLAFGLRRGVVGLWVGLSVGLMVAGSILLRAWSARVRSPSFAAEA
jgi:MATE family multidrug resistance protein